MAAERADHNAAFRELVQICLTGRFACQQLIRRTMGVAGIAARADFDGVQAGGCDFIQHLIQAQTSKYGIKYS
ncbi:hypothetical protein D3C87_1753530 [compost metagenome]